jgi:pseudouridine synthase
LSATEAPRPEPGAAPGVRLQKRLAELGYASRRAAEGLITAGRVRVNGVVVSELGSRVQADDRIEVDPDALVPSGPRGYVLNKPVGYVTTKGVEEGPTILDLLPKSAASMSYAGRLDKDSRGLVLLLADGVLNYALTAPGTHLEKEYWVKADTVPSASQLEKMAKGLRLKDGPTRPCRVRAAGAQAYRIWLSEGRNRQIRRMAEHVGLKVTDLRRERVGPLELGNLPEGSYRELSAEEEKALKAAVAPSRRRP